MNIDLPDSLFLQKGENCISIRDGTMEIYGKWNFEQVMKICSLRMLDRTRCYYCGRKVSPQKITVEHVYPKGYGGPSITRNFVLACESCNQEKGALNAFEYQIMKKMDNKERKIYYWDVINGKKQRIENPRIMGYDIPKSWYTFENIENIRGVGCDQNVVETKYYHKVTDFAMRTGKIPRPLLVSSNGFLMSGKIECHIAINLKLNCVPVIVLDNVKSM